MFVKYLICDLTFVIVFFWKGFLQCFALNCASGPEGRVGAAAPAGEGRGRGAVPPHGPPGALPQHHGQGDHRDARQAERQDQGGHSEDFYKLPRD